MKLGIALNIAGDPERADVDLLTEHTHLGDIAEWLGFSSLFVFEHHFSDYLISPCPTSLLTYFAGRSKTILLGTSAIILPWHQPLQVAERMLLLDALAGHRTIYGFGTGRAPLEFSAMAVDYGEALERWHEAIAIIRQAMAGQSVHFQGRFNTVDDVTVRPLPKRRSAHSFFTPASTAASAKRAAMEEMGLMLSSSLGTELIMQLSATHKAACKSVELPKPILFAPIFVGDDDTQAASEVEDFRAADRQMAGSHYVGSHDKPTIREVDSNGLDHIVGSSSTCLEALRKLQRAAGSDHIVLEISFGAMPPAMAEVNMRRVAEEILPIVSSW